MFFNLQPRQVKHIACFTLASLVHVVVLVSFSARNPFGAAEEGEGGIEVGIGLAQPQVQVPVGTEVQEVETVPSEPVPVPLLPKPRTEMIELAIDPVQLHIDRPEILLAPIAMDQTQLQREDSFSEEEFESDPVQSGSDRQIGFGSGTHSSYGGIVGLQQHYVSLVASRLNRYKTYPETARQAGQEGIVVVQLVLRYDGEVSAAQVSHSSGVPALDQAVLNMVERAAPFPSFPAELKKQTLRFNIPVTFSIESS